MSQRRGRDGIIEREREERKTDDENGWKGEKNKTREMKRRPPGDKDHSWFPSCLHSKLFHSVLLVSFSITFFPCRLILKDTLCSIPSGALQQYISSANCTLRYTLEHDTRVGNAGREGKEGEREVVDIYLRKSRNDLTLAGTVFSGQERKWNWVTVLVSFVTMFLRYKDRTMKSSHQMCSETRWTS